MRCDVEGGDAVLRVEDNGYGIAPELLPRIFDLFVQGERTLDRAQGGLGIGLTLGSPARGAARRHGVRLQRGTRARQCVHSAAAARWPRPQSVPTRERRRSRTATSFTRRVLIIEDNRDAREMFRMMLELSGHEVLEAEEGLSRARAAEDRSAGCRGDRCWIAWAQWL